MALNEVKVPESPTDAKAAVDDSEAMSKRLESMYARMVFDRKDYEYFQDYLEGRHVLPYAPDHARPEVFELRERGVMNLIPLLVGIPSQVSFIDGYRRGGELFPKEWKAWAKSNMASKQTTLFRAALTYGAGYAAVENLGSKNPKINVLSTKDTIAYFADPANDVHPVYALSIKSYPLNEDTPGIAYYYDDKQIIVYDYYGKGDFRRPQYFPHTLGHTPVIRFVCNIDDNGNTRGMVEAAIPAQDRVNQTGFDLLITQTFSSWKVRWASGMQGDPVFDDEGNPVTDANGEQVYRPVPVTQSRFLMVDDPAARLGTLDETPLDGFIEAHEAAVKDFAVVGQLPPHSLLGNMSNLSAETLVAAMSQTMRFAHVLKTSWGVSSAALLHLVAIDIGEAGPEDEYEGEVRWRDMSDNTLASVVDALGKAAEMLRVPHRALWSRIPGVTTAEIEDWESMADEVEYKQLWDEPTPQAAARREASARSATRVPTPLEAFGGASGAS